MCARTDREALLFRLALEYALLDKVKCGASLALHSPEASVPNIRVIEAVQHRPSVTY